VFLTQVVEGEVKKLQLCQGCADNMGVDTTGPESVADMLLEMETVSVKTTSPGSCVSCNMNRADFKKSGRLGCAVCYTHFCEELESVIQAMHHSEQHIGKVPLSEGRRAIAAREIAMLRKRLDHAILHEEYEEAAKIRDEIRTFEEEM